VTTPKRYILHSWSGNGHGTVTVLLRQLRKTWLVKQQLKETSDYVMNMMNSLNTRSSFISLIINQAPAGNTQTRMCRSKKNDTHVVGWCSDTDAIIGMWILA